MPCPKCGSHRIWDDNLAWGCCDCDFFTTGEIVNRGDTARDVFHIPAGKGQWKPERETDALPDAGLESDSTDPAEGEGG